MNKVRTISRWLALAMLAVAIWPTAAWAYTKPFNSVSFADALHGYIAGGDGSNGVILRTNDGGATPWQPTSEPGSYLVGVSSWTSGQATAVSNVGDGIFTTSDYGVTWNPEAPLLSRTISLQSMAYLSGSRRVVVGKLQPSNDLALIASSVGGATPWTINLQGPYHPEIDPATELPFTTYAALSAIDATTSGSVAWAVGNDW
ncbi:MAG TPA: hypothetical protein VIK32_12440, partial [Candidatus Limnocylindrales bacterium]